MTIDPTKKIIIKVSMLIFLFLIITGAILVPTTLNIRKTAAESYKLRVLLEEKYQQSLNSRITRKRLEEIKSASAGFDTFLFKSGDELKLITFFESTAAKYNLTQSINSSNLDQIGKNRTASISLNIKGKYNDALKYIAEIETSHYFINITQLQMTPIFTKEGEVSPQVNTNLSLELYVNE
jgi:hypothetical protein